MKIYSDKFNTIDIIKDNYIKNHKEFHVFGKNQGVLMFLMIASILLSVTLIYLFYNYHLSSVATETFIGFIIKIIAFFIAGSGIAGIIGAVVVESYMYVNQIYYTRKSFRKKEFYIFIKKLAPFHQTLIENNLLSGINIKLLENYIITGKIETIFSEDYSQYLSLKHDYVDFHNFYTKNMEN